VTPQSVSRPLPPVAVERCAATGITKPECHCPACLAALVAAHHRPAATA
jgi:hypothetical protein